MMNGNDYLRLICLRLGARYKYGGKKRSVIKSARVLWLPGTAERERAASPNACDSNPSERLTDNDDVRRAVMCVERGAVQALGS